MSSIIDKVRTNIIEYSMIDRGDSVVVGLSGGADSVLLLTVLLKLKNKIGFSLCAAHVNHGIRGDNAERDCRFCEDLCEKLNVPFHKTYYDIPQIAKEIKTSEENAGRIKRYEYFNELCLAFGYNKIAVAHNMNDSVETVIFNMIRGSSLTGLCGIKPVNANVIRPIFNICRDDIVDYLYNHNIKYCVDETNLSDDYSRNKIRNIILNEMEQINPSVVKTIFSNTKNLREDDEYIENQAKLLDCIFEKYGSVLIDKTVFDVQDISIKKRLILDAFCRINGNLNNIESKHINVLLGNLSSGNKYNMPCGITVLVSFSYIEFSKNQNIFDYFECMANPDSKITFRNSQVTLSLTDDLNIDQPNTLYIDYDKIKGNLILRSRLEGDKFVPYGMTGSKKLKQYLCELKIPPHKRDEVPILCDDEGIVAVIPYCIADKYKISESTTQALKIQMLKEN